MIDCDRKCDNFSKKESDYGKSVKRIVEKYFSINGELKEQNWIVLNVIDIKKEKGGEPHDGLSIFIRQGLSDKCLINLAFYQIFAIK